MDSYNTEYGLRLPNGKEVWGDYKGFPLETAEGRLKLAEALTQTESELNLPEGSFVTQHFWVKREWRQVGHFTINDSSVISEEKDGDGVDAV